MGTPTEQKIFTSAEMRTGYPKYIVETFSGLLQGLDENIVAEMQKLKESGGGTAEAANYQAAHGAFQAVYGAMTNTLGTAKKMATESISQVGR